MFVAATCSGSENRKLKTLLCCVCCAVCAVLQDEGWKPSITVKQILLGIQVRGGLGAGGKGGQPGRMSQGRSCSTASRQAGRQRVVLTAVLLMLIC